MKCLNCDKSISEKATYCSDKCRMAYGRRTKKGDTPNKSDKANTISAPRTDLTATDKLFEEWRPDYYNFDQPAEKRICMRCGKDFETELQLLNFCSPTCQREAVVVIANGPHANYLKGQK